MKQIEIVYARMEDDGFGGLQHREYKQTMEVEEKLFNEFLQEEELEDKGFYSEFELDDYHNWLENNKLEDELVGEIE